MESISEIQSVEPTEDERTEAPETAEYVDTTADDVAEPPPKPAPSRPPTSRARRRRGGRC